MRAALYTEFEGPIRIENVADPVPPPDGVVLKVEATGLCRSDWHGWMGHDPDIRLPHVPGHELAGTIVALGSGVKHWTTGDRVTVPFVGGCGVCGQCQSGNQQVCDQQFQPGFTHWGSFAEFVAIDYADTNLVRLPESMDFVTAASLGCRFVTSFRAVVDQGRVASGQWVVVHGCGGVGLSAIMIASAYGARLVAVDIDDDKLKFAQSLGADVVINARKNDSVSELIKELTGGGVALSIDALGSRETCVNSINCLAKRGRHVQVGLMAGDQSNPHIPMAAVIANELEIVGSHGMQAHRYAEMFNGIQSGMLAPELLIGRTICLQDAVTELPRMDAFTSVGVTVIDNF